MEVINVGVIGYGYWGPNLARNFFETDGFWLSVICDTRPERLRSIQKRYPTIRTTTDPADVFNDPSIDAVAIATPVATHFDLAEKALQSHKHVLVEKPIAATSEQALALIAEARRRKLVLMVDHTFVYTDAIHKIRELLKKNELGDIHYYDSVRVNLGLFQHDVNVLWDLAIHDLSIMEHTLQQQPVAVSATGMKHIPQEPENIAFMTLFFSTSLIAHFHVNWLAPVKVRHTLICGSKKMIVYNDLDPSEKIKVYDTGITIDNDPSNVYQALINYRMGDVWIPHLDITEALRTEVLHFGHCIKHASSPLTDGKAGLRVLRILEAATQSMEQRGKAIKIKK